MPDLVLDFATSPPPPVEALVAADVKAIFVYTRVSTPSRAYLEDVVAAGIGVGMIFERAGTRAFNGHDTGVAAGGDAAGDLTGIGIPDGVRLYVNMADQAEIAGFEDLIAEYARGFAESFPTKWRLGAYGPIGSLRAAQRGSPRFDALWGVESWYPDAGHPGNFTVQEHWAFWQKQRDVVLVQMANVPPPVSGTDTDWIVPGAELGTWGGDDDMPSKEEVAAEVVRQLTTGGNLPSPMELVLLTHHEKFVAPLKSFDGTQTMKLLDWISILHLAANAKNDEAMRKPFVESVTAAIGTLGVAGVDETALANHIVDELLERLPSPPS